MRIIIVGAGIGGLSAAIALGRSHHKVIILDEASQLAELGAGVQMTPQAIKYLFQWGLKDDILAESIIPQQISVRDGREGHLLGIVEVDAMEIRVVNYDFATGVVDLQDGQRLEADLVVAADGINSFARSRFLGSKDPPGSQPTGWAAFRMMAEVSKLKADPTISDLVNLETCSSNFWIAPEVSCMTYLVKNATLLNIVLSHQDNIDTRNFTLEEYNKTVRNLFKDFEPRVQSILNHALPRIANYPVYAVPPLPSWVHDSGRFTLIGDAAHAMAFYMSMGGSLAVEDAAVLSALLDSACPVDQTIESINNADSVQETTDLKGLTQALHVFEAVRKPRVQAVQQASLHGGNSLHVQEGKERSSLYKALSHSHENEVWLKEHGGEGSEFVRRCEVSGERLGPGGITDKGTRDWCYSFDAVGDAIKYYNSVIMT